ncbi:MAG TPA: glycoside hydrolase family 97 N-terminal domain-containing protein, partial [Puia sp.]|nr:glycoside hydrolase family 97 N-terminal domain-containing protein [Puia sp.]
MKSWLFQGILIFVSLASHAQPDIHLRSPDKKILVEIKTDSVPAYSVYVDEKKILDESEIDMNLSNGRSLSTDKKTIKKNERSVREIIIAQIPVSRKYIPDEFNELSVQFSNQFTIVFRAYNDGIAYRIQTSFSDSITVLKEIAAFKFIKEAHAFAPVIGKREGQDIFHTSFEELYPYKKLDSLSEKDFMYSPVLVRTNENVWMAITESDLDDYPGMFLQGTSGNILKASFAGYPLEEQMADGEYPEMIVRKRAAYIAKTNGSRNFPWRVMLVARRDKDLPANDLVYRLASGSTIKETNWIHPGKCTDEWIIDINLFNVPFRTGINTETYKYYIDFAKRFGFSRIMMDAGWSDTKDLFKINPDLNMVSLAAYARSQRIGLSMWTLSMTLNRQLDSALKQFQRWGVDFIMTDFIDRDDQKTVNIYKKITVACAKAKIMIMFHGAYPPKGFNRTYPNN